MSHNLTPEQQEIDISYMLNCGNHKLDLILESKLVADKAYQNEVEHQWMLPVPVNSVKDFKDSGGMSIGYVVQHTID